MRRIPALAAIVSLTFVLSAAAQTGVSTPYSTPTTGTTFVVPAGVTTITVKAWGAGGGGSQLGGGGGGFAQADITVTPGESLAVRVGGGGAAGAAGGNDGGGGGGYSGLFRGTTPLVIAAGGGGGGPYSAGAPGGGTTGGYAGNSLGAGGGQGGTPSGGGAAGSLDTGNATAGSSLQGGRGGWGASGGTGAAGGTNGGGRAGDLVVPGQSRGAGGGGGGYYGGGGGGAVPYGNGFGDSGLIAVGGGGGSSVTGGANQSTAAGSGVNAGNSGAADYVSPAGKGGASGDGNPGRVVIVYTAAAPPPPPPSSQWTSSGTAINYLAGNVGIGIAAPAQKLSVAGVIESTFGGFKFPDGTVQATAGSGGGGGAASPWTASGLNISFNSGNVGIGTTTPSSKLHLDGDLTISKNGTTYLTTETNTYPMIFLKSPPYYDSLGNPPTYGRVGLYADTAFLSDNVSFNLTEWVPDSAPWARSMVILQQGTIQFQTQVAGGANEMIKRMLIGPNGDIRMAFNGGNVGIGTNTPTAKLHVAGDVVVDGNIAAKYQDVAEWVSACREVPSGTVVVISRGAKNVVCESRASYDTSVAGVVSTQPGIALGEKTADKVLVAQSGRVLVKVDASYGAIHAGDLLVTSPTPGFAMRSEAIAVGGASFHRPGTLLGKALEPLASGQGEILVLLTLQ